VASGGGNRVIGGRNANQSPMQQVAARQPIANKADFVAGLGSSLALITAKVY